MLWSDGNMLIKKVLLIGSPRMALDSLTTDANISHEVYPPLGLMYLSAMIKRELVEIDVVIYDLHLESIKAAYAGQSVDWSKMVTSRIDEFQPDLVGLSTMFGASFSIAEKIGQEIRQKYPQMVIVNGGVHITGIIKTRDKEKLNSFSDFTCLNEAESHFVGLIRYLNLQQDFLKGVYVHNRVLLRDAAHLLPGIETVEDVDTLPMPDFGAVDLHNSYKYGILSGAQTIPRDKPLATLLTVRGCIARCTFCSVVNFNGAGVRMHSSQRVLEEIDVLYNEHGIRHIDFVDDDFTHSKQRTLEITQGLIARKYDLTWSIGNGIRLGSLTDELLQKMAESGCTYFSLGIESGDPEILKKIRKPLTLPMLRKGIELLQRHPQIYYRANFITGFPEETMEQLQRTFDVAATMQADWCLFSMCKPLPDTEMYNDLLENNYEGVGNNSTANDYSFQTTMGMLANEEEGKHIFDLTYYYNLKINFRDNPNLRGRNVERAVKDFERVTKISQNHAFAWHCLDLGYRKLNRLQDAEYARRNVHKIIENDLFWLKKFEELEVSISN